MTRYRLVIVLFFIQVLICSNAAKGQNDSSKRFEDRTPIEDLDYKLTKQQFYEYYGTDDTATAIINLFYRKRGKAEITYCLIPGLSYCIGSIAIGFGAGLALGSILSPFLISGNQSTNLSTSGIFITAGIVIATLGILVPVIIATENRAVFTRKKLLYLLVKRERGTPLPSEIMAKLRPSDF